MAAGIGMQIERRLDHAFASRWGHVKHSHRFGKTAKHRRERRRAKANPECMPQYRRYYGWEW